VAVLYEVVTGQRAFDEKSRASLIAAILSSKPRPISEPSAVPSRRPCLLTNHRVDGFEK